RGRRRYAYAEPSDKGRYLLAVLKHFETLPDAFDVLMNGYWRDVLISLGAVPVEKNTGLRGELISTLRKRLGRPKGDLTFSSETELDRLARESIRVGRMAGRSDRFVCRESSIVRGDGGSVMTVSPSRPEARSRFGSQTANELGAPVASSIPEQL